MQTEHDITRSEAQRAARDLVVDLTDEEAVLDLRELEFDDDADDVPGATHRPSVTEGLDAGLLAATRGALVAKRAMDVAVSALAIVALLPVLVITALAVAVSSRGPVFYVQERVGRGGMPFRMLKFRSMYVDAHARKAALAELNEATGPVFKVRKDPRVTTVGRVIRKLSLDELPQLVNVLRGDMSLVGPRPPLPEEYARYDALAMRRLLVTPGITCIWQVSGRSNIDFEQWVDMDVEYIRNWSLRLDLRLLVKTVPAVLTGNGAY